jgi:hypothetical protein
VYVESQDAEYTTDGSTMVIARDMEIVGLTVPYIVTEKVRVTSCLWGTLTRLALRRRVLRTKKATK